jgi:hypothetical protein
MVQPQNLVFYNDFKTICLEAMLHQPFFQQEQQQQSRLYDLLGKHCIHPPINRGRVLG